MSENKSAVKIVETDEKLLIKAGESFAEKSSATKDILQRLESAPAKKVSIMLSPKSKSFQDTFFLIRREIIKNRLKNAQLLLTSQSGTCFKQRIETDGQLFLSTKTYTLYSNSNSGVLSVHFTKAGKVYANEDVAKEIRTVIALEKPRKVSFHFVRAENEKHEAYIKRIKGLENYFAHQIVELYSIKELEFLLSTNSKPLLISAYNRAEDCFVLECTNRNEIPVKHSKHKKTFDAACQTFYVKSI